MRIIRLLPCLSYGEDRFFSQNSVDSSEISSIEDYIVHDEEEDFSLRLKIIFLFRGIFDLILSLFYFLFSQDIFQEDSDFLEKESHFIVTETPFQNYSILFDEKNNELAEKNNELACPLVGESVVKEKYQNIDQENLEEINVNFSYSIDFSSVLEKNFWRLSNKWSKFIDINKNYSLLSFFISPEEYFLFRDDIIFFLYPKNNFSNSNFKKILPVLLKMSTYLEVSFFSSLYTILIQDRKIMGILGGGFSSSLNTNFFQNINNYLSQEKKEELTKRINQDKYLHKVFQFKSYYRDDLRFEKLIILMRNRVINSRECDLGCLSYFIKNFSIPPLEKFFSSQESSVSLLRENYFLYIKYIQVFYKNMNNEEIETVIERSPLGVKLDLLISYLWDIKYKEINGPNFLYRMINKYLDINLDYSEKVLLFSSIRYSEEALHENIILNRIKSFSFSFFSRRKKREGKKEKESLFDRLWIRYLSLEMEPFYFRSIVDKENEEIEIEDFVKNLRFFFSFIENYLKDVIPLGGKGNDVFLDKIRIIQYHSSLSLSFKKYIFSMLYIWKKTDFLYEKDFFSGYNDLIVVAISNFLQYLDFIDFSYFLEEEMISKNLKILR